MPLTIFQRDENGALLYSGQGKDRAPIETDLPLPGEIASEDFCVDQDDIRKFGLAHAWLQANFCQNVLWVPEGEDFDAFKTELATFLSSHIKGPYYVFEGYVNTRSALDITLLDPRDIEIFRAQYGEWKQDEKAAANNGAILVDWKTQGRTLRDAALYGYAAP